MKKKKIIFKKKKKKKKKGISECKIFVDNYC